MMPTHTFRRQSRINDEQTHAALLRALTSISDVVVTSAGNPITVDRKRNILKNRWKMTASVSVERNLLTAVVDGMGSMQENFAAEIFERLPEGMLDDHGIAAAMERMNKSERFFGSSELHRLVNEVQPGEQVKMMASGAIDGRVGLIVLTDRRVLLKDNNLSSSTTQEINPRQITSIGVRKAFGNEALELTVSGANIKIHNLQSGRAGTLADLLRDAQSQTPQGSAPAAVPPAASSADELGRLAQLHASGVLTDDEFAAAKARILRL